MYECPYCGSDLRGSGGVEKTRANGEQSAGRPGGKNTAAALVSCPDCDGVIDGYSPH